MHSHVCLIEEKYHDFRSMLENGQKCHAQDKTPNAADHKPDCSMLKEIWNIERFLWFPA